MFSKGYLMEEVAECCGENPIRGYTNKFAVAPSLYRQPFFFFFEKSYLVLISSIKIGTGGIDTKDTVPWYIGHLIY